MIWRRIQKWIDATSHLVAGLSLRLTITAFPRLNESIPERHVPAIKIPFGEQYAANYRIPIFTWSRWKPAHSFTHRPNA